MNAESTGPLLLGGWFGQFDPNRFNIPRDSIEKL